MLLMYITLIAVLAAIHVLVRWRASSLERHFIGVAGEADQLVRQSGVRGGNTNRVDPYATARQQYELALAVLKRDRTEQRYTRWQGLAERLANWRKGLTAYKGKILPYAVGMIDMGAVLVGLQALGVSVNEVRALIGL